MDANTKDRAETYDACLLHSPRKQAKHIPKLVCSFFVCLRIGYNIEQHGYTYDVHDNQVELEQA